MKSVHCPKCKRLLFKANLAELEIMCGKCNTLVEINFYSQSRLLTIDQETSTINIVQKETIESRAVI